MSQKQSGEKEPQKPQISLLQNSVYYFLECVFILKQKMFQLLVIHNSRVLHDSYYRTIRGARIAFSKKFKKKSWCDSVKAEWTGFYNPDKGWLEERQAGGGV